MAPSYRGGYSRYVPVAQRRKRAARKVAALKKAGRTVSPVEACPRRKIATTFWGEAWCENLEAYRDFANRLPRGKTYVRNGSVVDLQIASGRVTGLVSGSELYEVEVRIDPLPTNRWNEISAECAGKIGSVVELLAGSISSAVMEVATRHGEGLFPAPKEILLGCSCPDWAVMCKHVAAVLYGVGARLDETPEHLFTLRGVDPSDLVVAAAKQGVTQSRVSSTPVLDDADLSDVFGIDIETKPARPAAPARKPSSATKKKPVAKKEALDKKRAAKRPARKRVAKKPASKKPAGATSRKKPAVGKAPARKPSGKRAAKKEAKRKR